MNFSWDCPICKETFIRKGLNRGLFEHIKESEYTARLLLQWDAINHLATHISTPAIKQDPTIPDKSLRRTIMERKPHTHGDVPRSRSSKPKAK